MLFTLNRGFSIFLMVVMLITPLSPVLAQSDSVQVTTIDGVKTIDTNCTEPDPFVLGDYSHQTYEPGTCVATPKERIRQFRCQDATAETIADCINNNADVLGPNPERSGSTEDQVRQPGVANAFDGLLDKNSSEDSSFPQLSLPQGPDQQSASPAIPAEAYDPELLEEDHVFPTDKQPIEPPPDSLTKCLSGGYCDFGAAQRSALEAETGWSEIQSLRDGLIEEETLSRSLRPASTQIDDFFISSVEPAPISFTDVHSTDDGPLLVANQDLPAIFKSITTEHSLQENRPIDAADLFSHNLSNPNRLDPTDVNEGFRTTNTGPSDNLASADISGVLLGTEQPELITTRISPADLTSSNLFSNQRLDASDVNDRLSADIESSSVADPDFFGTQTFSEGPSFTEFANTNPVAAQEMVAQSAARAKINEALEMSSSHLLSQSSILVAGDNLSVGTNARLFEQNRIDTTDAPNAGFVDWERPTGDPTESIETFEYTSEERRLFGGGPRPAVPIGTNSLGLGGKAPENLENIFNAEPVFYPEDSTLAWGLGSVNEFQELNQLQKALLGEGMSSNEKRSVAELAAYEMIGESVTGAREISDGMKNGDVSLDRTNEAIGMLGSRRNRELALGMDPGTLDGASLLSSQKGGSNKPANQRLAELEQLGIRDEVVGNLTDFYEGYLTGDTVTKSFSQNSLADVSKTSHATHFDGTSLKEPYWASSITPGSKVVAGDHFFATLEGEYVYNGSDLDNVTVVNVESATYDQIAAISQSQNSRLPDLITSPSQVATIPISTAQDLERNVTISTAPVPFSSRVARSAEYDVNTAQLLNQVQTADSSEPTNLLKQTVYDDALKKYEALEQGVAKAEAAAQGAAADSEVAIAAQKAREELDAAGFQLDRVEQGLIDSNFTAVGDAGKEFTKHALPGTHAANIANSDLASKAAGSGSNFLNNGYHPPIDGFTTDTFQKHGNTPFSRAYSATNRGGAGHTGIDVPALKGTPIYSITDGTVIASDSHRRGYGKTVVVQADNGETYSYSHNKDNTVKVGDRVVSGQQIATVGDSGNAKGWPHIHLQYFPTKEAADIGIGQMNMVKGSLLKSMINSPGSVTGDPLTRLAALESSAGTNNITQASKFSSLAPKQTVIPASEAITAYQNVSATTQNIAPLTTQRGAANTQTTNAANLAGQAIAAANNGDTAAVKKYTQQINALGKEVTTIAASAPKTSSDNTVTASRGQTSTRSTSPADIIRSAATGNFGDAFGSVGSLLSGLFGGGSSGGGSSGGSSQSSQSSSNTNTSENTDFSNTSDSTSATDRTESRNRIDGLVDHLRCVVEKCRVVASSTATSTDTTNGNATSTDTTNDDSDYAVVSVSVDPVSNKLSLVRQDIVARYTVDEPDGGDAGEGSVLEALEEEVPIIFNQDGSIAYSNGLYAPATGGGQASVIAEESPEKYMYIVESTNDTQVLTTDQLVSREALAADQEPGILDLIFGDRSPFLLSDIESVTYREIEVDYNLINEIFLEYAVTLRNGSERTLVVPQVATTDYYAERFARIGYEGNIASLLALATEAEVSSITRAIEFINRAIFSPGSLLFTDEIEAEPGKATVDHIQSLTVFPVAPVSCPELNPPVRGYLYSAELVDPDNPEQITFITKDKCAVGDITGASQEIKEDLERAHNFTNIDLTSLERKMAFDFTPVITYIEGVQTYNRSDIDSNQSAATGLNANGSFLYEDIEFISYRLIDRFESATNEAYYEYTITLTNGTERTMNVKQFSSTAELVEELSSVGYSGNPMTIVRSAVPDNTPQEPGIIRGVIGQLLGQENSNPPTALPDLLTTEPVTYTINNIKRVYIYPDAEVACPNIQNLQQGYVYEVMMRDYNTTNQGMIITEARCGGSDVSTLISAIGTRLEETYQYRGLTLENLIDKSYVVKGLYDHSLGVVSYVINDALPPDVRLGPGIPNKTSAVSFEVRALDEGGQAIIDWTTEDLVITPNVNLEFRWSDNNTYEQCLVFLNDNDYQLTRSDNPLLTTGNTGVENYDVTEENYTYRVECSGQNNGELGVDVERIQITVN